MTDDSTTSSHFHHDKAIERHSVYDNDVNNKSRKFRWSSCFSFITKFKKTKAQKIRLSQSFEEFAPVEYPITPTTTRSVPATIQVLQVRPSSSIPWRQQPSSSLSPPPRRAKSKRESASHRHSQLADNTKVGRRPLIDPTLTPRVKPRSIKTKKQPSLLRLSLDADLLQSPDSLQDNESLYTCKTGHSSSSFTLPQQMQPFRSGTLGATTRNNKLSLTLDNDVPPLPLLNIPSSNDQTRPNSQSTSTTTNSNISFADSPVSVEAVTLGDASERLTLKERRQRKSPLSMPDTEQLTLALKELLVKEEDKKKRKSYQDEIWRQQLLEQSIAFSFQNKSRQEAMLILEGKKSRGISLQPIVDVHELDHHFDVNHQQQQRKPDVVRDKAQYDAIVSSSGIQKQRHLSHEDQRRNTTISNNNRTSLRARSPSDSSTNEKKVLQGDTQPALGIIKENEVATIAQKMMAGPHLSVLTPETPPHHQQNAPSLISAPSTPNSIDSVFDHEEYMIHERQPMALALDH